MASVYEVMAKITADTSKFEAGIGKAETKMEDLSKSAKKESGKAGKIFAGFAKGAVAGVATAVAGVGAVLGSGVSRLTGIEEAQAKLKGLGNTAESVDKIMGDALTSVRGTAFGMAEAATTSASAVAAGIEPGQELATYLTTVADTAYIAGIRMDEMGKILNKSTTTGVATNESLMQLAERGIPIYNMLSDSFGTTTEEIKNMASAGEISSQQLMTALEQNIGGAAQKSGETVQGAFANMMASFQRVGANLAGPVYDQMQGVFSGIIEDMGEFEDKAKVMGEEIGKALAPMLENLGSVVMPLIELMFELVTPILGLVNQLQPLFDQLVPIIELFVTMVNQILPPITEMIGHLAVRFAGLIEILIPLISNAIEPLLSVIEPLMKFLMILADIIIPPLSAILQVLGTVFTILAKIIGAMIESYLEILIEVFEGMKPLFNFVTELILTMAGVWEDFGAWISSNMPVLESGVTGAFEGIGDAIDWLMKNFLGPLFDAFKEFLSWLGIEWVSIEPEIDYSGMEFPEKTITAGMEAEERRMKGMESQFAETGFELGEGLMEGFGDGIESGGAQARDVIAEFYGGLYDDIAKQNAKTQLEALGLSEGLIDSVVGAGEGWEDLYQSIISGSADSVDALQDLFNQTSAGLQEQEEQLKKTQQQWEKFNDSIADFRQEAGDVALALNPFGPAMDDVGEYEGRAMEAAEAAKNLVSSLPSRIQVPAGVDASDLIAQATADANALLDTYSKQTIGIGRQVDNIEERLEDLYALRDRFSQFAQAATDVLAGIGPLKAYQEELGQFSQSVQDQFAEIEAIIAEGVDSDLLSSGQATMLREQARLVEAELSVIAKQRDGLLDEYNQLLSKLEAAQEFRKATEETVTGFANISDLGTSSKRIVYNLQQILERTQNFSSKMLMLSQMGLNKRAYEQILNSGYDAGTATANALISGGQEAIDEVNNLYSAIEGEATKLADDATVYMFDGGEDMIQAFMDGIVEQDQELFDQSAELSLGFVDEFQSVIDQAGANIDSLISSLESQREALIEKARSLAQSFADAFQAIIDQLQLDIGNLPSGDGGTSGGGGGPEYPAHSEGEDSTGGVGYGVETEFGDFGTIVKIANQTRGASLADIAATYDVPFEKIVEANPKFFDSDHKDYKSGYKQGEYLYTNTTVNIPVEAATGGLIRGAGTATSDSIPAMLSNGEYVMNAAAVSRIGVPTLNRLNAGKISKYADGGLVGTSASTIGGSASNTYNITVQAGVGDPAQIGKEVVNAIAAYEKTSGRRIL